jgi:hypothetical protein
MSSLFLWWMKILLNRIWWIRVKRLIFCYRMILLALEKIFGDGLGINGIGLWWLCIKSWCVVGQYDTYVLTNTLFMLRRYFSLMIWSSKVLVVVRRGCFSNPISFHCSLLMEMIGSHVHCLLEERLWEDRNRFQITSSKVTQLFYVIVTISVMYSRNCNN